MDIEYKAVLSDDKSPQTKNDSRQRSVKYTFWSIRINCIKQQNKLQLAAFLTNLYLIVLHNDIEMNRYRYCVHLTRLPVLLAIVNKNYNEKKNNDHLLNASTTQHFLSESSYEVFYSINEIYVGNYFSVGERFFY